MDPFSGNFVRVHGKSGEMVNPSKFIIYGERTDGIMVNVHQSWANLIVSTILLPVFACGEKSTVSSFKRRLESISENYVIDWTSRFFYPVVTCGFRFHEIGRN
jgi:hypothetical protein